jgi:MYXO-CTERM domain-containing protein
MPASSRLAAPLLALAAALAAPPLAAARDVPVTDGASLRAAIDAAAPGDVIVLADGEYVVDANLRCDSVGREDAPIVVRAANPLGAHLRSTALEGFLVSGAHWRFEGLDIEGRCANDSDCEHAWHVVGAAHHTVIRGNRAFGFNAQIKANGTGDPRVWPNDVLVENNEFFNPAPRMTSNPVTPIDVVGGRRWVLRGNYIHDHQKGMGDGISYAAFLKGNGRDGIIEGNLVVCERLHTGGTRLGLSFGGGGSSPDSICEDGTCSPEHQGGILRNNLVVHCPADVAVYVNECADCLVAHNTFYDTTGIDVRFAASRTRVIDNLLSGRVRARDGAMLTATGNLELVAPADWAAWFADPGAADFTLRDGAAIVDQRAPLAEVVDDYCGNDRDDARSDIGALEYDGDRLCDTTRPGTRPPPVVMDGGVPEADAGASMDDGGAPIADGGAGLTDGGTETRDAGSARSDGGATSAAKHGGCGCRVARESSLNSKGYAWLSLLVALAATRRARRALSRPS